MALSRLPRDIITSIVKTFPFSKQYNLATELFPGLDGNDYACEFAERQVYMSEIVSRVYDDLPKYCVVYNKYDYNLRKHLVVEETKCR